MGVLGHPSPLCEVVIMATQLDATIETLTDID